MVFIKSVIIFCLFNLTLLLTKDPAIEWNPGPGNYKKIIYIYIHQIKRKSYSSVKDLLIMTLPIFQVIDKLWLPVKSQI